MTETVLLAARFESILFQWYHYLQIFGKTGFVVATLPAATCWNAWQQLLDERVFAEARLWFLFLLLMMKHSWRMCCILLPAELHARVIVLFLHVVKLATMLVQIWVRKCQLIVLSWLLRYVVVCYLNRSFDRQRCNVVRSRYVLLADVHVFILQPDCLSGVLFCIYFTSYSIARWVIIVINCQSSRWRHVCNVASLNELLCCCCCCFSPCFYFIYVAVSLCCADKCLVYADDVDWTAAVSVRVSQIY